MSPGGRPRAFDHDRAIDLRAEGWTYAAIAQELGVSANAVARACNSAYRARQDAKVRAAIERQRQSCLGGCGRMVWMHMAGRSGYCTACFNERKAAGDVREDTLRCKKCHLWKPDDEFAKGGKARRGKRQWCRSCETAARRANRQANTERERAYDRERKARLRAAA